MAKESTKATEVPEEVEEAIAEAGEYNFDTKTAATALKKCLADHGIDNYVKRKAALALKVRYNDLERSEDLFNAIMALDK